MLHRKAVRRKAGLAVSLLAVSASMLAACGGDDSSSATENEASAVGTAPEVDLASVCPNPIVIQANWTPESTQAPYYALIGTSGEASDTGYSGPALADPRVTVEIRSGGPVKGFQSPTSLAYSDRDIFMAMDNLTGPMAVSKKLPTVSVFAPISKFPQTYQWGDPALEFESLEDIRDSGLPVLTQAGEQFTPVFVSQGRLDPDQVDDGWDGSPARFVAAKGQVVQKGWALTDPYQYEHVIRGWEKPIEQMLIADEGYPDYASAGFVLPETLAKYETCLQRLVPLLQQGMIDYLESPESMNETLVEVAQGLNSPVSIDAESLKFGAEEMRRGGFVANDADGTYGAFDMDTVGELIDVSKPVFEQDNARSFDPSLTAEDLVTNKFIDDRISLP